MRSSPSPFPQGIAPQLLTSKTSSMPSPSIPSSSYLRNSPIFPQRGKDISGSDPLDPVQWRGFRQCHTLRRQRYGGNLLQCNRSTSSTSPADQLYGPKHLRYYMRHPGHHPRSREKGTFDNASIAMKNFKNASCSVDQIAKDIASGKGTLGRLIKGDDLYFHVNAILGKIDILMNDINHYGILFHLSKTGKDKGYNASLFSTPWILLMALSRISKERSTRSTWLWNASRFSSIKCNRPPRATPS